MKRAHFEHLLAVEKDRKPGYFEACLKLGRPVEGTGGQWMEFTEAAHAQLRRDFAGRPTPRFGSCNLWKA